MGPDITGSIMEGIIKNSMVVDFHSHVLAGIDDGSSSVEESVAMLRLAAQQGITHVMATPHFYAQHDTLTQFLRRRKAAELRLREAMEGIEGLPKLTLGAEVRYFRGISRSDGISQLTYEGTNCLLLEMPETKWTEFMYQELETLWKDQGLIPVIAHMDRYISPLNTHGIPERLKELPVLVQANASFFIRRSTGRMAKRLLRDGYIHLLGSDCHNMTSRMPNLGPAVDRIQDQLGSDALRWIKDHENKILHSGHGSLK